MDLQTIIFIVIGVSFAIAMALYFLVENAFDRLFDWIFGKAGFSTGNGPLSATAERVGDKLRIKMQNQGPGNLRLAAIEGQDSESRRYYPQPCFNDDEQNTQSAEEALKQFSAITLASNESKSVSLQISELDTFNFSLLAVIDANGNSWNVSGFKKNGEG